MDVVEILPNIYIDQSIIELVDDPRKWTKDRISMEAKIIGGIHNMSLSDLIRWSGAGQSGNPVRIIESGSNREKIIWPGGKNTPDFVSLKRDTGVVTSFTKNGKHLEPAIAQTFSGAFANGTLAKNIKVERWYEDGILHRNEKIHGNIQPAIFSKTPSFPPKDPNATYIDYFLFSGISEYWKYGEWTETIADGFKIKLVNAGEDWESRGVKAVEWIAKHCRHGFFPLRDKLFANGTEEFLFMADIAS